MAMSKKRIRKIEFMERKIEEGESRGRLIQRGLHHMKMSAADLQQAFGGNIYGSGRKTKND